MSLMGISGLPIPHWWLREIEDFDKAVETMQICHAFDRETAEYLVKYLVSHSMHSFYSIQGAIAAGPPWVDSLIAEALEALQRRIP